MFFDSFKVEGICYFIYPDNIIRVYKNVSNILITYNLNYRASVEFLVSYQHRLTIILTLIN